MGRRRITTPSGAPWYEPDPTTPAPETPEAVELGCVCDVASILTRGRVWCWLHSTGTDPAKEEWDRLWEESTTRRNAPPPLDAVIRPQ